MSNHMNHVSRITFIVTSKQLIQIKIKSNQVYFRQHMAHKNYIILINCTSVSPAIVDLSGE